MILDPIKSFLFIQDGSLNPDGEHISRKSLDILGEDMGYVTKELCQLNKSLSPKLNFKRPF